MNMKSAGMREILGCLLLLIWAFGLPETALGRSLEAVLETGELRACVVPISPAYLQMEDRECRENCSISGPVPQVVGAFARSLGDVRPVFHRLDWDEQFHNEEGVTVREAAYTPHHLKSRHCDLYPTHLTRNPWRSAKLDFAVLFPSQMMVIVQKEHLGRFLAPADLAGKRAAVAVNTSHHTWVQEENQKRFKENPIKLLLIDNGQEIPSVASGAADFTLLDAEVSLWESVHRFQGVTVALPVGPIEEIGWGFAKADSDLRDAAQSFFDRQIPDESSALNRIWKEAYGVTLNHLRVLIRATQSLQE